MDTPNVGAMHFAHKMDTDPDFTSGEQAVRGNAATHYNPYGAPDKAASQAEEEKDLSLYRQGKADLQRYSLKYTGRATVAELAYREIPDNAVASCRLYAGYIATTQAYRYAYAIRK